MKSCYHIITPEAVESLVNSQRSENASIEKPSQVKGHPPKTEYNPKPKAKSHQEMLRVTTMPIIPNLNKTAEHQVMRTCTTRTIKEIQAKTKFLSWHWRNLWTGNRKAKLKWSGIIQRAKIPVSSATSEGCPMSFKMGVAYMKSGRVIIAKIKSTIQARCMYMPNMLYFLAPKAWPHNVSNALANPNWERKGKNLLPPSY